MIPLPEILKQSLASSGDEPVRLTDPETRAEYVLLPAERYDDLERLKVYDDGPLTEQEKLAVLAHVAKKCGWDDPEMDVYDEFDPRRTQ